MASPMRALAFIHNPSYLLLARRLFGDYFIPVKNHSLRNNPFAIIPSFKPSISLNKKVNRP